MSDPVSNSEIEDVLASIRRLVSENAKALKGDRAREPEADKLVLTPALRVDESEAPQAAVDVFAVDTETWNDVPGASERVENKDVFTNLEGSDPVVVEQTEAEGKTETTAADGAHEDQNSPGAEGIEAALAEGRDAALNTGPEDGAEAGEASGFNAETQAETQAGTESAQDDSSSANDLEQRIAELETAMDLHPSAETSPEHGTAEPGVTDPGVSEPGAPETGQGDETTHRDGPETPADVSTDMPAAEVSDAPPKSWIEGLVAAAASAEAARLAARAPAPEGVEEAATREPVADRDEIAAMQEAETVSEDGGEAGLEEAGADISEDGAADTELAAKPFELTAEHAAPVEPEAGAPEVEEPEAADIDTPEGVDTAPETVGVSAGVDLADGGDATAADVAGAEDAEGAEDIGDTTAESAENRERSWVDRLIVAAATLRNKPDAAEAGEATPGEATDEPAETASAAGVDEDAPANAAALDGPADEVVADTVDAQEPEDNAETQAQADATEVEIEAAPALAPLNLVDPIVTKSEPENVVPEWESVDLPEEAANDAEDPVVDIDTVLTGPWSAAAVGEALDESVDETLAEEPADEDMATVAKAGAEAGTLSEAEEIIVDDAADVQEVPAGALEWEPVDPPQEAESEADGATGALEMGADAEAEQDTETGEADIGVSEDDIDDDVTFEADTASEDIDYQDETEAETGDDEATGATGDGTLTAIGDSDSDSDGGEANAIDEDSAAVAAAAEAEVDWGDAGMAAAGVAAMTATLRTAEDREDASASPAAEGADDADRSVSADEIVVDEGMLRELVAQLVRDELQGTVGERITQNVRRLIRREIARALTLQDFEK